MSTLRSLRNLAVLVILTVAVPSLIPSPAATSSNCSGCYPSRPWCTLPTSCNIYVCGGGNRMYWTCYDAVHHRCCNRAA